MADVTEADRAWARDINRGAGMPAWERGEPANLEDRIAHALADRGEAAQMQGQWEILNAVLGADRENTLQLLIETMVQRAKHKRLPVEPPAKESK